MRHFNEVLGFGPDWVDTECMITYEDLTRACLEQRVMPAVVPQL